MAAVLQLFLPFVGSGFVHIDLSLSLCVCVCVCVCERYAQLHVCSSTWAIKRRVYVVINLLK
jgi:hypothetical protein